MKHRWLLIDFAAQEAINDAVEEARRKPRTLAFLTDKARNLPQDIELLKLSDRPPDYVPPEPGVMVHLERGYTACISFEEQPPGLCRHLSVSVDEPGKLPFPESFEMIAEAFGIPKGSEGVTWVEEFEPGHFAVNIVALDANASPYQPKA